MIRVTFVLPSFAGGGAERVLLTFVRTLDRARFEPVLVIFDAAGPLASLVPDDVQVHNLARPRLRQALPSLVRELRRLDPAVIVSTLGYVNLALLATRRFLPGHARFIVREANLPLRSLTTVRFPGLMAIAYRRLYPHADAVICPAQAIADSLHREFGIDTRRLRLIYNPVDETAIRAAATPIMREPGPGARFVAAGRLTAQKGFDRLLDMMAEIPGDGRLTILGDGSDRPALEAQAARLNIGGRVTFAGFDGSPWARYAGADAFLLPSRWEGMPNAALEALACGTKVIACPEAGGIGEVAALASAGAVTVAPAGPDFVAALRGTVVASPANLRPSLLPAQFEFAKAARAFEAVLDATASLDQPARRAA